MKKIIAISIGIAVLLIGLAAIKKRVSSNHSYNTIKQSFTKDN